MKNIFEHYYKRYDSWYAKNRFAYLSELEAMRKTLPKQGKGLEIGVGTGRFAYPLGIAIGIDPARSMIKMAKARGVDARLGRGEHLPFKTASFDYVTIIISLCFVRNPSRVLAESKRVLKKKGRIVIGIIDRDSFLGKFYQKKNSIFYKQANFFQPQEVIDLLKARGFKEFSCYQAIFQLPDKINAIEKPKKGFGKGGFVVISAKK